MPDDMNWLVPELAAEQRADDPPWDSSGVASNTADMIRADKAKISELEERLRNMASAASSAAATTVTAIERIQEMEKVVTAAEAWVRGGSHAALTDAVKHWQSLKKGWS